jgi:hypothetical protein
MLAFSWEEASNTCSHASAVLASLVAAASPLVTRTAKTRVAASCRRVEAQPFTGSESTAPASTQMSTGNEYPNEPFTRWQRQRTRLASESKPVTLTTQEARLEMDHKDATMSRGTRVSMAVVSLSLVVCACGAVTPPSASSPTATPTSPTATPTSVDSSVASLMLTTTEYAAALSGFSGAKPATRVSDAEVSGQAGTDQREFFASDGSALAAMQLYVQESAQETDDGYSSLLSNSCPPGGHTTSTHPKIGTAEKTDEFTCLANGIIQVEFEQGLIIGDFATSPASGAVALARAESANLPAETSPAASLTRPTALGAGSA